MELQPGQVRHGFIHDGKHADAAGIELVETADPDPFHPLDILRDSVDGHVPVHPMPPHARPGFLRRIRELFIQSLGAGHLRDKQANEEKQSFFHTCKDNLFFEKPRGFPTFVSRIQANDL